MKPVRWIEKYSIALITLTAVASACHAQPAPGEDPVLLQGRVSYNMLPLNNAMKSSVMMPEIQTPSWMQAKLARLQAKAFSADTTGILTDADVTTSQNTIGLRKTCVQDVGSITQSGVGSGKYGPQNDPQVVVLRGDLVNICR
ncbi:MAG: hypothetical protein ACKOBF_07600 [Limnohabitans sp.]